MEKGEIWEGDEDGSSSSDNFIGSSVSEIMEVDQEFDHGRDEILSTINEESGRTGADDNDDNVYVAVGKSETSMDALRWALQNALKPSSTVFLVHIFPEVRYVPTPLGKLPKSQANPDQLESCMILERSKRMQLLQKFLKFCSVSQVRYDTILIESDDTAKALVDLIPVLNIRKLVLGTTKSSLKKGRRKGIADVVQRESPESCEVNIIFEGKDVSRQMMIATTPTHTTTMASPSPSPSPRPSRPDEEEAHGGGGGGGGGGACVSKENVITKSPRHDSHTNNNNLNKSRERDDDSSSLCMCFFPGSRRKKHQH